MLQLQNMLGNVRAESDLKMLNVAFVETPEYKGIVETRDFNFVVGRRGTGKSALKYSAINYLQKNKTNWIFDIENNGHSMLSMQSILEDLHAEYIYLNHIMTVVSKVGINLEILKRLEDFYKKKKLSFATEISTLYSKHKHLIQLGYYARCVKILQIITRETDKPRTIPSKIAEYFQLDFLENVIQESLDDIEKQAILFFDNLDEGWVPKPLETSIIGGLAHTASNFKDRQRSIHIYIFARDNMFRAVAALDTDFTRNIEGAVVRLKWDDSSLFHLVVERIKQAFSMKEQNNTRIWNRVAKNELSNRSGFLHCTNKTLYRPRDILSLLNQAFIVAMKDNREAIILNDVEVSAKEISASRLKDLANEYDSVFPSLNILIEALHGCMLPYEYSYILELFSKIINENGFNLTATCDFGIFNTPEDCFFALYSIGFLGVDHNSNGQIVFCHDGASIASGEKISNSTKIWIHPCYWDALSISSEESINIISKIYDDYSDISHKQELIDLRIKQIGSVITDIGNIPEGKEGASLYEDWVLRAIKILFHNSIKNPQLHPNGNAISRRDIVGTIDSQKGFWARVNRDYNCRQVLFEAKNYSELTNDDVRQVVSYLSGNYGDFGIIVPRRRQEAPTKTEVGWIREVWYSSKKMIFIIPHSLLIQCISKQRSKNRYDYTEDALSKKLDTFERSYIAIRHCSNK